ncbi:MAG: hypothetical protein JXA23_06810, partial [Bacteroidales bacterium]|nr:hypothetical protein [Bacteroidales bacterium]
MKRVKHRIFLLIGAVGILAAMVVTWQYRTEKQMINRFVDDVMIQRGRLALSLLGMQSDFFESLTHDYTFWDEMVDFIREPDFDWAIDNIRNIIDAYEGNAVWVFDTTGKMVYGAADPDRGDIVHYPLIDSVVRQTLLRDRTIHRYIRTSAGLIDLHGATVHPTSDPDHETTPLGFFFTGKLIDSLF